MLWKSVTVLILLFWSIMTALLVQHTYFPDNGELAEVPVNAVLHRVVQNRQRLAIASALLHEPNLFVIDEPMVGQDPVHAKTVKQELKARSHAGMTILMSTHLFNVAEELADRIGMLHRGKLIAHGTMDELRTQFERQGAKLKDIFLEMVAPSDD